MKTRKYFIESFGGVWKLSGTAYARLLRDIKADKDVILDNYGTQVVTDEIQSLSEIQENHRQLSS